MNVKHAYQKEQSGNNLVVYIINFVITAGQFGCIVIANFLPNMLIHTFPTLIGFLSRKDLK